MNDLARLKRNGSEIERVAKVKSLRVIVDEGLKWRNQRNFLFLLLLFIHTIQSAVNKQIQY